MEAPATDKEAAGQEAEEEPEEGTYVSITKTSLQTNLLTSRQEVLSISGLRTHDSFFYLPFFIYHLSGSRPFFSLPAPQRAGGCGICLSMTSHKYKSRKKTV